MAGFDAGSVVEPLSYTFRPHVEAAGTIREPDDKQIAAFLTGLKEIGAEFRDKIPEDVDTGNPAEILAAIEDLDTSVVLQVNAKLAGLYADLCSGAPSRSQVLALPPRIRTIFFSWLQQEVLSPEAVPGGGSTQQPTRLSVAAG